MSFYCEVFPVILQSAGSGFLTNQENPRVRGVTKVMSSVTRGPSCDHRHPVNSYSIVA